MTFRIRRTAAHPLPQTLFLIVFLSLIGTTGCQTSGDFRPEATGPEGQITVVIDSAYWYGEVGEALREELSASIETLPGAPEPEFLLRPANISLQFEALKNQKNLLFVAPLSAETPVARFFLSRIEGGVENLAPEQDIFQVRPDLWRRQQLVVYLAAATPESLVDAIEERAEDLRYAFNEITRTRITREMFERGRQVALEDTLMERHGFAVNVQHDYVIALDTTRFVWLRRILADSWRSLFVYYEENANPAKLSPEWIYETRNALTQRYIQGNLGGFATIDFRRPLETENINFLGRYGFETRGIWDMKGVNAEGETYQFGMAGPFVNYTFYDESSGRIYMIDGMVFAPGYEKREFLRQLEVIAHTFRSQEADQVAARE